MSQKCVGKCLQEIFKGHTTGKEDEDIENSVYKRWRWRERLEQSRHTRLELVYLLLLLFGFLVQTLLLPILLPCYLLYQRFSSKQDDGHWRHWLPFPPGEIPFVTWYANAVGYLGFVGILIARSSTVEKEDSMTILDWIVIVYVVALVCQELRQIIIERRQYLRRPSNWFDMVTLLTLVVGYAVRHEGFARGKLTAVQASEFILGFATIFACLRLLSYVKLHQRIGPILISFGSITRDVIYFLVIFGVFLLAFSAGIAGIFRGSLYSETMEPAPRAVHGYVALIIQICLCNCFRQIAVIYGHSFLVSFRNDRLFRSFSRRWRYARSDHRNDCGSICLWRVATGIDHSSSEYADCSSEFGS